MTFALLDGWPIPVANTQAAQEHAQHGDLGPSWMNRPTAARRSLPKKWTLQTAPMLAADADTLECLVSGRAHRMPCDFDAFSDSGIGPDVPASGNYSIQWRTSFFGWYGPGYLNVSGTVVWDFSLRPDRWTVMYWRNIATTPQHVIVRSDGAKFLNGVRADTTDTSESTVQAGGLALGVGDYDDIVVMPVVASDGFCMAFYRFATGKSLSAYLPYDSDFLDFFRLFAAPSLTGGVAARALGKVGQKAVRFFSNGRLAYAANTALDCNGQSECSVEVWFIPTTQVAVGSPQEVLAHGSLTSRGYRVRLVNTTTSTTKASLDLVMANGAGVNSSIKDITINAWNHVVVTWDQATNRALAYVNGQQVYGFQTSAAGTAAANDSTDLLYVGNSASAGQPFTGTVDEVRFYKRKLTAAEVQDHYQSALRGIAAPVPQECGAFPYLKLDGDVVSWRQTEVLGEVQDQPLVQGGSTDIQATLGGVAHTNQWTNSRRSPKFILEEKQAPEVDQIPPPLAQVLMDERWLAFNNSANLRPSVGGHGLVAADVIASAFGEGPYHRGRAMNINTALGLSPPQAMVLALGGGRGMACVMWVRRLATGTLHHFCGLSIAASSVRFGMSVSAANTLSVFGRATSGDGLSNLNSGISLTDTTRFHMIVGQSDYPGQQLIMSLDDTSWVTGAGSFGAQEATVEAPASGHRIGTDIAGTNRLNGWIAAFSLYNRLLTQEEVRAIYRQGVRGMVR